MKTKSLFFVLFFALIISSCDTNNNGVNYASVANNTYEYVRTSQYRDIETQYIYRLSFSDEELFIEEYCYNITEHIEESRWYQIYKYIQKDNMAIYYDNEYPDEIRHAFDVHENFINDAGIIYVKIKDNNPDFIPEPHWNKFPYGYKYYSENSTERYLSFDFDKSSNKVEIHLDGDYCSANFQIIGKTITFLERYDELPFISGVFTGEQIIVNDEIFNIK